MLLNVAFGDHQVTDYQADVEARTIGARAHRPVLFDGRWPDTERPLERARRSATTRTPARRSTTGTPGRSAKNRRPGQRRSAPNRRRYENLPNRTGEDPHGAPRATPAEQQLVSDFFDGAIPESDNCGGGPCFAIGFSGP